MKKKFPVFIVLSFLMMGCRKEYEAGQVRFSIYNGCFNDIFVNFVNTETNDTDQIKIIRYENFTIHDLTLPYNEYPNWYNDFDIHINSITNFAGDTVNFNPNIPSNWGMQDWSNSATYVLYLGNDDF